MGENVINFWELLINILSKIWPLLLGNGGLFAVYKIVAHARKDKHKFDAKMDELISQNKQLTESLISYVPRTTLDTALQDFLHSNYIVCAILGPAGSGKTRFAQNITKRNSCFSKYHYIYINEKSGAFFASEDFKNNFIINGRRRYVFIFDYIFENVIAINNLLDKALQSGKHKFIFVERDYGWSGKRLLDRPQFQISMEQHRMNAEMLANVFYNQVNLLNKKYSRKKLSNIGASYTEVIVEKIDPIFSRPIFAQLVASIFVNNETYDLSNIDNVSEVVEQYWYYKFNKYKIHSLVHNHLENVDSIFIENIEILLRIILLTASITKQKIVVTKKENVLFQIHEKGADENNMFYNLILDIFDDNFIQKLNMLESNELQQLFGITLNAYIVSNKRSPLTTFDIFAELDLVSEWVLSDSLKRKSSWVNKVIPFLSFVSKENYLAFLRRSSMDFPDVIQLFGSDETEFINLLLLRINEAYVSSNQFGYIAIGALASVAKKIYSVDKYNKIVIKALVEIKSCYKKTDNKELTEQLLKTMGGD